MRAGGTIATGMRPENELSLGRHLMALIVTDNDGAVSTPSNVLVTVTSQLPTADAGPDQTVTVTDGSGTALVDLSGSGTDPDGTIVSYVWTLGDRETVIATGPNPTDVEFGIGANRVLLTVTDNDGDEDRDDMYVTVVEGVATPVAPSTPRVEGLAFDAKCAESGVILCEDFEDQAAVDAVFVTGGTKAAVYDTVENAAKLFVPSESHANTSGSFNFIFPRVSRTDAGEQNIWTQYRVKYQQDFIDQTFYADESTGRTTSWKTSILWGGSSSCAARQLVINRGLGIHAYTQCGGWGFRESTADGKVIINQAGGDTSCIYKHFNPKDCLDHRGEVWATYTTHVNLDTYHAEIWVKYDDDPVLYKIIDMVMPSEVSDLYYDHMMLTAYMTGKDNTHIHPEYELWFDNLVVSTEPIAMTGASPYPDTTGKTYITETLVDFGSSVGLNVYGTSLTTPFKDRYESYSAVNGGGIAGYTSAAANHAGVSGTPHDFSAGEKIRITFYNNSDSTITAAPMLSFTHDERFTRADGWFFIEEKAFAPRSTGVVEYVFSNRSEGSHSVVNVANYPQNLILDKIEHIYISSPVTIDDVEVDMPDTYLERLIELAKSARSYLNASVIRSFR
jgi:hypothetical protein